MPWWDFLKRNAPEPPPAPPGPAAPGIVGKRPATSDDPATRARRRQRLERRVTDLRYDLAQAQAAASEPNRWTERIDAVDQAIAQARADAETALAVPAGRAPLPLPPLPVTVEEVQPVEPALVRFRVGDAPFHYAEEVEWSERGTQRAPGVLGRVAGEVEQLLSTDVPAERRDELREHLAHALVTYAEQLRDARAPARVTLADLASPCPVCAGWRDLLGRCPACQERQWQADRLRADAERLMKERNDLLEELQRMRERLPVLQRQLAEAEEDLAVATG